eukprot:CAMPEP_0197521772 /NCGR_PEP_ID=MMETSP1318-20131121/6998_1 /TAXON_ID=552666 /ORGANISM="Partenskyella glossopodia, Strain RCC365" /LENGTH=358 /DNA_ID=CAMNT_0043073889 /DNA_START=403 /DNA_END=1480 /DNA_ORIENTATION=+
MAMSAGDTSDIGLCGENTLLFVLKDGLYGFPGDLRIPPRPPLRKTGSRPLKITVSALLQQHTHLVRSIEAHQALVSERHRLETDLNSVLSGFDRSVSKSRQVEASLSRLKNASVSMQSEAKSLKSRLKLIQDNRQALKQRANIVLKLYDEMKNRHAAKPKSVEVSRKAAREKLVVNTQLYLRRLRMLSLLYEIYPVERIRVQGMESKSVSHLYTIRGLTIPDSLSSATAMEMSIALGYCAQFTCLVAKYLGVVLRYQIIHNGSKSWIVDDLADTPQRLALYYKETNAKTVIQAAVGMLVVDITQLLVKTKMHRKIVESTGGLGSQLLYGFGFFKVKFGLETRKTRLYPKDSQRRTETE